MKRCFLFFVIIINALNSSAQQGVGISTLSIHPSAIVDLSKSNKGLLIPRLTQTARTNISHPAEGLIVYDSTLSRLYQYQDASWQSMITNSYWSRSSLHNYIFSLDSVGIGSTSPDARLEVNGNIRGRGSLFADNNLFAVNTLQGSILLASTNIVAAGTATIAGDIITQTGVVIDHSGNPTLQLKSGGQNKVFMQASGDDLRLGTNSGNTSGKTIIRMNGTDIISIDTSSSLQVLTGNGGGINMGVKLSRQLAINENMLPVFYGRINANATIYWTSDGTPPDHGGNPSTTVTRTGAGTYIINTYGERISARAAILITVGGTAALAGIATFNSVSNFTVQIFNPLTGSTVDADFNFLVMDPYNLYN